MSAETSSHPPPPISLIAGFESTYVPSYDVDVAETTGHAQRWQEDLSALRGRVRQLRYPIRWHRIEAERGHYDWRATDAVMAHLREAGLSPIVDLLHHGSYPRWLDDGLRDPRFGPAFVDFAAAVAARYPWIDAYTLMNEPFTTLHFAGNDGLWPPHDTGVAGMARLVTNVLPALSEAAAVWRQLRPAARHIWVDTCEHHAGPAQDHVAMANDRRHTLLDLALGHDLDLSRPYLGALVRAGAEDALHMLPMQVDVLGLDYYAFHEWWYDPTGGHSPSPQPLGFAAVAEHYWHRYGLEMMLTETNLRGLPSDRVSWLRYVMEQYELAVSRGVPLRGLCWFPHIDSTDWDSLLTRAAGRVDPVGVVGALNGARQHTIFTSAWEAAAAGAGSSALPAYRFQLPAADQLAGFLPQMAHWNWVDPPVEFTAPPIAIPPLEEIPMHAEVKATGSPLLSDSPASQRTSSPLPDLVVVSHLRWTWVWQRPQHLVSRFAKLRAMHGALTWYVEEPVRANVTEPTLRTDRQDGVIRVWLDVPGNGSSEWLSFDAVDAAGYGALLAGLLRTEGGAPAPDVLLYTPLAIPLAEVLNPSRLVYDVMDDLSSFKDAPPGLVLGQRRLLAEADVVFTGGRSLHRFATAHRSTQCHLFPSGVETSHYAAARRLRAPRRRKVAGYVGVVDERLDLELIAGLAATLPDWEVRVVGPVAKIDPAALPQAPNLSYRGQVSYDELPAEMAGFDVALMPFALNDATRSISPTKTLEYLAAGLPVVSTRVPDVVADYTGIVRFADDAAEFAAGCRQVVNEPPSERERRSRHIRERQEWDVIATAMHNLIRPGVASTTDHYSTEVSA